VLEEAAAAAAAAQLKSLKKLKGNLHIMTDN